MDRPTPWRRLRVVALTTLTAGTLALMPAPGHAQSETKCRGDFVVTLSPGVGSQPTSGSFHTGGETGTINCEDGRSGTIGVDGRYGTDDPDTCTGGGEGWGVHSFTLGESAIKSTFTFAFGGISGGFVSGTVDGERLSGTFTFTPTKGDCATTPATEGRVRLDATLR